MNIKFSTAVDLNKCLKQIKLQISFNNTCAPISMLLSNTKLIDFRFSQQRFIQQSLCEISSFIPIHLSVPGLAPPLFCRESSLNILIFGLQLLAWNSTPLFFFRFLLWTKRKPYIYKIKFPVRLLHTNCFFHETLNILYILQEN